MSGRAWLMLGGAAVVVVVALVALASPRGDARPTAPPSASGGLIPAASVTAPPPTADPPSAMPSVTSVVPSAAPTTPPATPAPRTSTAPRLAYAAFLRRINDDRATVDRLNANLSAAVQAQDPVATRPAAVAILDFVDRERDWLRDNPPADCYAAAHQEAGTMLDAYGMAADAFIAWADTGGGLAGLAALGDAVDLAQTAAAVSTMFGQTLDATRCPS
jgi:type IV secretory pathway VirB10-like protein